MWPLSSPADPAQLALFAPYCGGLEQEASLQQALPLLAEGRLDGERLLRSGASHRFVLTWDPVRSPLTPCCCRLELPAHPELAYAFTVAAHQLVMWLMHRGDGSHRQDLPDTFWQWLLLQHDPVIKLK